MQRDVLLLGEAAALVSNELKNEFPDLPWEQPSRLRNRIVHGYWSIDLEILHTSATDQLPTFSEGLRQALAAVVRWDREPIGSRRQRCRLALDELLTGRLLVGGLCTVSGGHVT